MPTKKSKKCDKEEKTEKKRPTQSRNWCFTDWKLLDWNKIYNEYKDVIRFIRIGDEIAPETGNNHYQGWIQFYNPKRRGGVKRTVGSKALSCRPMYGSEYQNEDYCCKDGKVRSWGKFISQGHRTDLEIVMRIIKNDGNISDIADQVPSMILRYSHGCKELLRIYQKKLSKKYRHIETTLHYGKTGCGKTRDAVLQNKDHYLISGSEMKWWDGYEGEKTLIIDEYNNDVPLPKLLDLLQGNQRRLPIKCGFTYARWEKVIITTNLQPEEIHPQAKKEHLNALWKSRITETKHYLAPGMIVSTKKCDKATKG